MKEHYRFVLNDLAAKQFTTNSTGSTKDHQKEAPGKEEVPQEDDPATAARRKVLRQVL